MSNYTQLPQQGGTPYPPQGGYPAPIPNQAGYPAPTGQGYPPQGQGYPAPAGQGYPPQGQGYPPQGQGYPPQGQGYASQGQGYPAPAQGYPPQGQGFPPQGQGFPPQGQGYPAGAPPAGSIPQYAGEMPETDTRDNPSLQDPAVASAPPPELPQVFPGYGHMGFNEASVPPPAYEDVVKEPPSRDALPEFVNLTSEEAKGSLDQYVAEHCCYGKGPTEKLNITDIQGSSAFHYLLESYCESRTTKWESEPYSGGAIVVTGPPPGPWDISVPVPELFKDSKMKLEVPNTSTVKPCHVCFGAGYKRCFRCHGRGQLQCNFCNGSGTRDFGGEVNRCSSCQGNGRKKCYSCHGYGQTKCNTCKGFRQLRWFIQLTVKWHNHDDDHVVERTALPPKLIKGVAGRTVLQETGIRVYPVNHFPDEEINQASNELVGKHATKFTAERMLQQRHTLRVVPVNSVNYRLDAKLGTYFVYGMENKVYFPDYPASCCWGCNIL